jgi:hypothetical protein
MRLGICSALFVTLAGCASLAVNPCDSVADRDGKYIGRFFLGVSTLGLSEITIQEEEVRQAYEVRARGCPVPEGVPVVTASVKEAGEGRALGTLVNGTPWALAIYLNQDPDAGAAPITIIFPGRSMQLAFDSGQHHLVARPTGAAPGDLPEVTWSRQIELDPRVRGFKLELNQADFK